MNEEASSPEIAPADLIRRIESGEEIHVLDVRAPFRLANGTVDIVPPERFHNIRGSELLALDDPERAGLPRSAPVAVVCGYGKDSRKIASHLSALGYNSASLAGGMVAWMASSSPRELDSPPDLDRLVQFDRTGKGSLSYVLISDGEALIVDPPRETAPLIEVCGPAKVVGVADTHGHADYISGGSSLARELGVAYYLHPKDAVYPYDGTPARIGFEPAEAGREIRVGRARVVVEHTPGHTEGSVCYRIRDHVVLTGDFIFIESVGRPDLGGKATEWTETLWQSLERARSSWPSGILVYPGHYASASERDEDFSVGKPFGDLRPSNHPLTLTDRQQFTEWVLSKTGDFPAEYRRIKGINLGLEVPSATEMDELEAGRNQCALS
jgi:glyoxylase-like metal-dependent hydrolase (beta-lactamase superfamily II)